MIIMGLAWIGKAPNPVARSRIVNGNGGVAKSVQQFKYVRESPVREPTFVQVLAVSNGGVEIHGLGRFIADHGGANAGSAAASAHINNLVVHIIFGYGIGGVYGRGQVFNGEAVHVQVGVGGVGEDQSPLRSLGRAGVVVKTGGGQGCSGVEYHE